MKKSEAVRILNSISTIFKKATFLLFIVLITISCGKNTEREKLNEGAESAIEAKPSGENIHVAFAGGGWRAHTAHTAWTMSLLENNSYKLDSVFANVESIGSNSGGSWFSTMLMYSPKFVTDIEKPGALSTWGNTTNGGWLGGQQKLFDAMSCHSLSGDAFVTCVVGYYSGKHLEWNEAIKSLVFKDYSLGNLKLDGTRQKWASDKSLLIASTMLTNNVVLNSYDAYIYNQYYQACLGNNFKLHGKDGGSCSQGIVPDVTPVTFSSIPKSTKLNIVSPPFFPEAGTTKEFHIGYSEQTNDDPDTASTTIKNPIVSDQVEVMHAAAASSAAVGFAASENVTGSWKESYGANNFALNFSLENGTAKYKVAFEGTSVSELASSQRVSFADGGPVDNSGVAQLVSFLQLNAKDSGFNIVAFDNVQGPPFFSGVNEAAVGSDIAMLLGRDLCLDNKFCTGLNCDGTCVTTPELQIFESTSIEEPITWSYPKKLSKYKNSPRLIYTKYKVTTTTNATFGIKAGSTGYLHAFTCYYPDAPSAPQNETKDGSFKAYNDMMQFINAGLKANSNEGLIFLEKALGLEK